MSPIELNQRFTFDQYVLGQANRLAAAAGRRVAEMPGQAYNPLFIYSGSGLGKTHLLNAIGHHARKLHPQLTIVYDTLVHFLDEALDLIESGQRDALHARVEKVGLLLLDDVQFLADRRAAQEELLHAWDLVTTRGGQVVLASDRPPAEINGLDQRLLSRFSGGLLADIGVPDYETRVAILNRKANELGQTLAPGVPEALARMSFSNVRELQGGLNKLVAVQDLDQRLVEASEIPALFGPSRRSRDEYSGFLTEISGLVTDAIGHSVVEARLAESILRWQGEGFSTRRLEAALAAPPAESEIDALLTQFADDAARLLDIEREVRALEADAPELSRTDLLRTPDRLSDAERLLASVRERNRRFEPAPAQHSFAALKLPDDSFALRTARAVAEQPSEKYSPFFVVGADESERRALLAALSNALAARLPERPVAFVTGAHFSRELIRAIDENCVESWRIRYRRVAAFILDDIDALVGTERAQEELFHLFEDLKRAGVQLAFGSAQPSHELAGLNERLRTRLDSGLVVSVAERTPERVERKDSTPVLEVALAGPGAGAARNGTPAQDTAASTVGESAVDEWFLSREKVLWTWPYLEDWLLEELE